MKLLTAAAVIALTSATAAFAQSGMSSPTNLNAANQSPGMSSPSMSGKDMQGQAAIQKPAMQGAMKNDSVAAKPAKSDAKAGTDQAKIAKHADDRSLGGAKDNQTERAQTQQLNEQQLANGGRMGGNNLPGLTSPQTAARPPQDNNLNCIENTTGCTPAIPPGDH